MRHGTGGQGGGGGQGRVDGHHLGVHRQASVGVVATAAVARNSLDGLELGLCSMLVLVGLRLVAGVGGGVVGGGEGEGGLGQGTGLEDAAAVVSGAVVVEALADDLAAFDDDTAMAIVERREMGLLDTEIEVEIRLHG